jgi:hypothetical protein
VGSVKKEGGDKFFCRVGTFLKCNFWIVGTSLKRKKRQSEAYPFRTGGG